MILSSSFGKNHLGVKNLGEIKKKFFSFFTKIFNYFPKLEIFSELLQKQKSEVLILITGSVKNQSSKMSETIHTKNYFQLTAPLRAPYFIGRVQWRSDQRKTVFVRFSNTRSSPGLRRPK